MSHKDSDSEHSNNELVKNKRINSINSEDDKPVRIFDYSDRDQDEDDEEFSFDDKPKITAPSLKTADVELVKQPWYKNEDNFYENDSSDSQTKVKVKKKVSSIDKRVVINIGGVKFETYRTTLNLISESRLAHLSPTNSDYDPVRQEYFFDRDPTSFSAIINYYRTGRLHVPNQVCGNLFYEELNFWGIGERSIQPCCWTNYSIKRECDEVLREVVDKMEEGKHLKIETKLDYLI